MIIHNIEELRELYEETNLDSIGKYIPGEFSLCHDKAGVWLKTKHQGITVASEKIPFPFSDYLFYCCLANFNTIAEAKIY